MSPRTEFHSLTVARVDPLTDDSAAVTFHVPDDLRDIFAFAPFYVSEMMTGCEVPSGEVSGWLVHEVRSGDVIDVQPPAGSFSPDLEKPAHHVLIAAGSGITPMMSIAASVLAAHDDSSVTLLYGNRRSDSVMFVEDVYPSRMNLVHVLSREPQEVDLFNGRLDADKLRELLPVVLDVEGVHHWWLCGPFGMVTDAIEVLTDLGVARDRVHRELFYVEDTPPAEVHHTDAPVGPGAEVTLLLDGRTSKVVVPRDTPILDAAQRVRPDLPFACKGGVCGTCRARVAEGEVRMRRNYALEQNEVDAGYVLTCQSLPVSDIVIVDYDA